MATAGPYLFFTQDIPIIARKGAGGSNPLKYVIADTL
jgi:hypothetical protein